MSPVPDETTLRIADRIDAMEENLNQALGRVQMELAQEGTGLEDALSELAQCLHDQGPRVQELLKLFPNPEAERIFANMVQRAGSD